MTGISVVCFSTLKWAGLKEKKWFEWSQFSAGCFCLLWTATEAFHNEAEFFMNSHSVSSLDISSVI